MKRRGRFLFLVAAVLLVGGAAFVRWQRPIYVRFYAHRLAAADLGPDAAAGIALELAKLDPAETHVAALGPRGRARYRIATGFEFRDVVGRILPTAREESELKAAVNRTNSRAAELTAEVAADVKTPEGREAAEALLAGAPSPDVRKRAATALGYAGAEALPALRRAFNDPVKDVAAYAFVTARRLGGPADLEAVLRDALASKHVRARALVAIGQEPKPVAVRLLIAALELPDLSEQDRISVVTGLETMTAQKLGSDVAAWKTWAAANP